MQHEFEDAFLDKAILAIVEKFGCDFRIGMDEWSSFVIERATALSLARQRKLAEFEAQHTGVPAGENYGDQDGMARAGAPVPTPARPEASVRASPGGRSVNTGRAGTSWTVGSGSVCRRAPEELGAGPDGAVPCGCLTGLEGGGSVETWIDPASLPPYLPLASPGRTLFGFSFGANMAGGAC